MREVFLVNIDPENIRSFRQMDIALDMLRKRAIELATEATRKSYFTLAIECSEAKSS